MVLIYLEIIQPKRIRVGEPQALVAEKLLSKDKHKWSNFEEVFGFGFVHILPQALQDKVGGGAETEED